MRSIAAMVATALALTLLVDVGTTTAGPKKRRLGPHVPDEVLVKFEPGVSPASVARVLGARIVARISGIDVFVLKVPPGTVEATILALTNNSLIEYAEPNGLASIALNPNDPYDNTTCYNTSYYGCVTQWAWTKVSAYGAWDVAQGSTAVRIAVVDSGVDNNHPDLPTMIAQHDFIDADNNAEDDNGHGTHVTGTIGALTNNAIGVAGANWSVGLIAAKVVDASGVGTYSTVANGIIWAADMGAGVINISLTGSVPSSTLEDALEYAWNEGAVLTCAAGNSGSSQEEFPAAYRQCIAVAATNANDQKASFSNYGSWVDLAAPGVGILSTMPNTAVFLNIVDGYYTNYDALSGTSMAAPHVAGLAGLIWARTPCTTNACIRYLIETAADVIANTGVYWTWGRVNYLQALD